MKMKAKNRMFAVLMGILLVAVCAFAGITAFAENDTEKKSVNIALNKTVTTSGNAGEALTDGSLIGGEWSCPTRHWQVNLAGEAEEWVIIDLGESYVIDAVNIYPGNNRNDPNDVEHNAFPGGYDIQISTDGENFETVKQITGDTDNAPVEQTEEAKRAKVRAHELDGVVARYVRVFITQLSANQTLGYICAFGEIEVYSDGESVYNLEQLQELYDSQTYRTEYGYTSAQWTAFTSAMTAAKEVLDAETPTAVQISNAYKALDAAVVERAYTSADNLALNKAVTASSVAIGWSTDPLTDGNFVGGEWLSLWLNFVQTGDEWITVDLGGIYFIDRVNLYPGNNRTQTENGVSVETSLFPEDYDVQVSTDNENFTVVASRTGDKDNAAIEQTEEAKKEKVRAITFNGAVARYVRVHVSKFCEYRDYTYAYLCSFSEVEVFGNREPLYNLQQLQTLYDSQAYRTEYGYTSAQWTAFTSAMTAAKEVLESDEPTDAQINNAYRALNTAIVERAYTAADNLALNKTVTTSGNAGEALTDGSLIGGEWSCPTRHWQVNLAGEAEEWITIDLGALHFIDKVNIYPGNNRNDPNDVEHNAFPGGYDIQTSADGENFGTVKQITGDTDNAPVEQTEEAKKAKVRTITFNGAVARYVRVYITRLSANQTLGYICALGEVEVYGEKVYNADVLQELYNAHTTKQEEDYLSSSWTGFATALASAKSVLDKGDTATKAEIREAHIALEAAVKALKSDGGKRGVANIAPKEPDNITMGGFVFYIEDYGDKLRAQFQLAKEAGIDQVANLFFKNGDNRTAEAYGKVFDIAAEYGVKVRIDSLVTENGGNNPYFLSDEELLEILEEYGDHPGFGGFGHDEPMIPDETARGARTVYEYDPDIYSQLNFLPYCTDNAVSYQDWVEDFGSYVYGTNTVLSLDVYAFPMEEGTHQEATFYYLYEALRKAGLQTQKNTGVYVQSVGGQGFVNYRRPEIGAVRYNVSAALAYGMKTIQYFCWRSAGHADLEYTDAIIDVDGEKTDFYEPVAAINSKMHTFGQYLAKCDAVQVYHGGSAVQGGGYESIPSNLFIREADNNRSIVSLFKSRKGTEEYMLITNKDFLATKTLTFSVKNLSWLKSVNDTTGELSNVDISNGTLTITLAPGDCALFQIPTGTIPTKAAVNRSNLARDAQIWMSSSLGKNGMYVTRLNDGEVNSEYGFKFNGGNESNGEWINLDLGSVKTFNRIDLYPLGKKQYCGYRFPQEYVIEVSADGETWTTAVEYTTQVFPISKVPVLKFNAVQARYIHIAVYGSHCGIAELAEIEVYNDNGSMNADIDTAYEAPGDASALEEYYNRVKDTEKGNYTEKTWTNFVSELRKAATVISSTVATQDQIDARLAKLKRAHERLSDEDLPDDPITSNEKLTLPTTAMFTTPDWQGTGATVTAAKAGGVTLYSSNTAYRIAHTAPIDISELSIVVRNIVVPEGAADDAVAVAIGIYDYNASNILWHDSKGIMVYLYNNGKIGVSFGNSGEGLPAATLVTDGVAYDITKGVNISFIYDIDEIILYADNAPLFHIADGTYSVNDITGAHVVFGSNCQSHFDVRHIGVLVNWEASKVINSDKTALAAAMEEYEALKAGNYTAATWATAQQAYQNAEAAYMSETVTQERVDELAEALSSALEALEAKSADKADLTATVATATAKVEADYTEASWTPFAAALTEANTVLADEDALQSDVDAAFAALVAAMKNLAPTQPADTMALYTLYNANKNLKESAYTAESWAPFESALENAREWLLTENATQGEIDAVYAELDDAVKGLVEAEVKEPDDPNKPGEDDPNKKPDDEDPNKKPDDTDNNQGNTDTENKGCGCGSVTVGGSVAMAALMFALAAIALKRRKRA